MKRINLAIDAWRKASIDLTWLTVGVCLKGTTPIKMPERLTSANYDDNGRPFHVIGSRQEIVDTLVAAGYIIHDDPPAPPTEGVQFYLYEVVGARTRKCVIVMDPADTIYVSADELNFESEAYHLGEWCETYGFTLTRHLVTLDLDARRVTEWK
jgi:hypothetical protein